jgi:hypothetical protein
MFDVDEPAGSGGWLHQSSMFDVDEPAVCKSFLPQLEMPKSAAAEIPDVIKPRRDTPAILVISLKLLE